MRKSSDLDEFDIKIAVQEGSFMASYKDKLKLVFDNLTYSEEKLASFIDENKDEIRQMTSQQVADRVGIGQSTVIRFSQKLGYRNFKKMLADIGSDHPDEYISLEIDEEESTGATNEKIREQYNKILDMTFQFNQDVDVDEVVDYLFQARRIICCGFSERNIYFAQYFTYKLSSIGYDAFCGSYMSLVYTALEHCHRGDAIIILSESGETRDLLNFAKKAKKKGMRVISITRVSQNSLQGLSDKNLRVVDYGSRTFLRHTMIRMSYMCVLDMLFLNLVKRDFAKAEKTITKMRIETKLDYHA